MEKSIITLEHLVKNINVYDDSYDIFLEEGANFLKDDLCMLTKTSSEDIINKSNLRFRYFLGTYTLKDIINNLYQQKLNSNTEEILEAINFYYKNDAFIDLSILT